MPDGNAPVTLTEGQAAPAPDYGVTAPAPAANVGQATAPTEPGQGQAPAAPTTPDEPTFLDPTQIPEELKPFYKSMQGSYTKKMQGLSGERQKIEAYDAFMQDPVGQMQQVARNYGYQLSRTEAAAAIQGQQAPAQQQGEWEPQTWDEVMTKVEQRAEERIMAKLQPFIGNVQQVTAKNIERQLAEIDPEWATYQDNMRTTLQKYPQMVDDVEALYRNSVPPEVLHSRAVQQALSKFQSKTEQAKVSGSSKTSRSEPAPPDITKMTDREAFNWAVEDAKRSSK